MTREKLYSLNPGETMLLKQDINNLSELAAKAMLAGLIHALFLKGSISKKVFEEILADAKKYSDVIKQP
jgi:hypothetical protein